MVARTPFRRLELWQKASELAALVHRSATEWKGDASGIVADVCVCARSASASIAQGSQRVSDEECLAFFLKAKDALAALHSHLVLARDTQIASARNAETCIVATVTFDKMLQSFMEKLGSSASLAQEIE